MGQVYAVVWEVLQSRWASELVDGQGSASKDVNDISSDVHSNEIPEGVDTETSFR